jgi:hypothetical protein
MFRSRTTEHAPGRPRSGPRRAASRNSRRPVICIRNRRSREDPTAGSCCHGSRLPRSGSHAVSHANQHRNPCSRYWCGDDRPARRRLWLVLPPARVALRAWRPAHRQCGWSRGGVRVHRWHVRRGSRVRPRRDACAGRLAAWPAMGGRRRPERRRDARTRHRVEPAARPADPRNCRPVRAVAHERWARCRGRMRDLTGAVTGSHSDDPGHDRDGRRPAIWSQQCVASSFAPAHITRARDRYRAKSWASDGNEPSAERDGRPLPRVRSITEWEDLGTLGRRGMACGLRPVRYHQCLHHPRRLHRRPRRSPRWREDPTRRRPASASSPSTSAWTGGNENVAASRRPSIPDR